MKIQIKKYWDYFLHFIFPTKCLNCDHEIINSKLSLCAICESELSYTFFENYSEATSLDKLFWGRKNLRGTYALLYFEKAKQERHLLHAIKYQGKKDLAIALGERIGEKIKNISNFKDIDAFIPVPLHPKKRFIRGFNQAEEIAVGISKVFEKPVDNQLLQRIQFTETQTNKNKIARWQNMKGKFSIRLSKKNYRHIAIVDDVVTTGATIESCIDSIKSSFPDVEISVISLATTR